MGVGFCHSCRAMHLADDAKVPAEFTSIMLKKNPELLYGRMKMLAFELLGSC